MTRNKIFLQLGMMLVALLICFVLDISVGSVDIPIEEIINFFLSRPIHNPVWQTIIADFRLPKAIVAVLAGAALSVSGLQMQTLFRNPVAGPYILGISSGASLGVALLILSGIDHLSIFTGLNTWSSWSSVIAASLGASVILAGVLLIAGKLRDIVTLLIVGLMIGSAFGALVNILQYFSNAISLKAFVFWTLGSLDNTGWKQLPLLAVAVIIGLGLDMFILKSLNNLLLGEEYAISLGTNVKVVRWIVILSTGVLAGSITAFCGPIAFIGIAVPHLCRMVFNSSDHRILFPASILTGASLLLICDIAAHIGGTGKILPINTVTSLVGAPVVIWIVVRQRNIAKRYF